MSDKFSPQLLSRCKTYFQERCGQEVTKEEAESYLDSLGDFYAICKEMAATADAKTDSQRID